MHRGNPINVYEVCLQLQEVNARSVITLAKVEELEREKTAQFRNTFELEVLVDEKFEGFTTRLGYLELVLTKQVDALAEQLKGLASKVEAFSPAMTPAVLKNLADFKGMYQKLFGHVKAVAASAIENVDKKSKQVDLDMAEKLKSISSSFKEKCDGVVNTARTEVRAELHSARLAANTMEDVYNRYVTAGTKLNDQINAMTTMEKQLDGQLSSKYDEVFKLHEEMRAWSLQLKEYIAAGDLKFCRAVSESPRYPSRERFEEAQSKLMHSVRGRQLEKSDLGAAHEIARWRAASAFESVRGRQTAAAGEECARNR